MKQINVCLIIFAFLFTGCQSKSHDEEHLKTIIARYNNTLIDAYKNIYFEPLKKVASNEEVGRIVTIVTSYIQGNQLMEPELHSIDFKEIKIEKETATATVKTSEDWSFRWINYKTGKDIEPLKDIHYEMSYSLIKKDGKWIVNKTTEIEGKASTAK